MRSSSSSSSSSSISSRRRSVVVVILTCDGDEVRIGCGSGVDGRFSMMLLLLLL